MKIHYYYKIIQIVSGSVGLSILIVVNIWIAIGVAFISFSVIIHSLIVALLLLEEIKKNERNK